MGEPLLSLSPMVPPSVAVSFLRLVRELTSNATRASGTRLLLFLSLTHCNAYAVIDDSTISVRNSCGTFLGRNSVIEGTATTRSAASLRVNFPGVPFQDPNGPTNYRITYLEDDYSLAIVGGPNRLSGFVLSRTPGLSAERWSKVRSVVEERGYNPCTFLTVPMQDGRGDITPLCRL